MSSNRPRRPPPSTLERAVIGAVNAAPWLTPSDNGTVWLLRDLAMALDNVRRQGTLEGTVGASPRDLAELAGRAVALLRELGLTPHARFRLGLWDEGTPDLLATVEDIAHRRASVGDLPDG